MGSAEAMDVSGTVAIAASAPEDRSALSPPGERNTAFTGALVEAMRTGDPEARPEYLTFEALVGRVRHNLARETPRSGPQQSHSRHGDRDRYLVKSGSPEDGLVSEPITFDLRSAVSRSIRGFAQR
jgi:hypothetical protein